MPALSRKAEHGRAEKAEGLVGGRGEQAGAHPAAAAAGLEKDEVVVPADAVAGAGLGAEIEQVGAAAEDDVLGVDGLFEGGMEVGVGSAPELGAALEEGDPCSVSGEGNGGGDAGEATADDEDIRLGCIYIDRAGSSRGDPVAQGSAEPPGEDGELGAGGQADALGDDVAVMLVDAGEQSAVDLDHDPEGGAAVGVDQREELAGGGVEAPGAGGDAVDEAAFVGLGLAALGERKDVGGGHGEVGEHVEGKVEAAALGVLFHIAEDVGELEGDAGLLGEWLGAGVGVAEDADADEADDGGDEGSSSDRDRRRCGSRGGRFRPGHLRRGPVRKQVRSPARLRLRIQI